MTSPAPSHRPALAWRAWLRTAWLVVTALVAAVGALAALQRPGPLVSLLLAGMAGLVAGGFTFAFGREDMAGLWRGVRVGAWMAGTTVVAIGLGRLFGAWSALVLGVVLVTSPLVPLTVAAVRRRRTRAAAHDAPAAPVVVPLAVPVVPVVEETTGQVDMTEFELALLDTEEDPAPELADEDAPLAGLDLDDLCRMWRRTSVLLRQRLDPRRLDEVLEARQHCLDELLRRHPVGTRTWLDAVGTRADDPRPFLTQERGTI